ncbi:hypothetical protein CO229_00050 [Mycoplasmopsis bovirhinis]|nr:hypothetical protein CO229_00050 [Mycoplasmopsis bovirhinis]
MIFEAITITWSIIFLIWGVLTAYNIIYIKKRKKELLFFPNLFFLGKKQTQEYFLNNSIKLEDFYFENLIKIIKELQFKYKKLQIASNHSYIWNFIIGLLVWFFAFLIPLSYIEFKFVRDGEWINTFIWSSCFLITVLILVFVIGNGYLSYLSYGLVQVGKITLENIKTWREKNQSLINTKSFLTLAEFSNIYQQMQKPKKILINTANGIGWSFYYKIEYGQNAQKYFETPEKYLYFISVLPYNDIKINYKRIKGSFTSWF